MTELTKPIRNDEQGFTLIELLVAIVVVGILAAVAIVGIGSLNNTGSASACQASADAAKAASVVHFANKSVYPSTFADMTGAAEYDLPSGVTGGGTVLTGKGWTLTMGAGGATANTFTCA
jgi:prepilin-type N-terminal cleavage/methylation domain-containing protein